MNEKNYDYLKDQIKYTGFGEGLKTALKENIERKVPEFQLQHQQKFGQDEIAATLHFKKSSESDMYFFNRYDLSLKNVVNKEGLKQIFYVSKENSFTLKEAYNLLDGRAVNKDLATKDSVKYNAWVQLDFKETDRNGNFNVKQYHQNYGYNMEEALAKIPIKEMATATTKTALMDSLKKGNCQVITIEKEGKEQRYFAEANPKFKSITVYDSNMQKVNNQRVREAVSNGPTVQQEKSISKKTSDEGDATMPAKRQQSKKKKSISIS